MPSHGIKDQVAIVGAACTPFGEHWDRGADELMVQAANEALGSAGIEKESMHRSAPKGGTHAITHPGWVCRDPCVPGPSDCLRPVTRLRWA